ncbi:MAG: hypothetical protein M1830_004688 [Pleopsidium flavum]|nr:MAG: hypothetical protein M1830_004688 [Pleopsidium flavum]
MADTKRETSLPSGMSVLETAPQALSTHLQEQLLQHGLGFSDGSFVCWQKTNPSHPRNWTGKRKAYDFGLIIFLDFFTTTIGTAGTAASEQARYQYDIGRTLSLFSFTSIYMLGQGVGCVFFPPYSESFGRRKLYVVSTIIYCIFCIVIAAVPSLAAVLVGRVVTGALSAIPAIVVAGSIEDLFDSATRIWMMFAWATAANLGLVVGPIVGTYVTAGIGWRWVFYIAAIVTGVMSCLLLGIRESRPSQLLERKVSALREATGEKSLISRNPDYAPDLRTFARIALLRPLRLFFTEIIVFMVSVISAVAFGLIYLFTVALPVVYGSFGFSDKQSSLAFIAIGIGLLCGIFTRLYDRDISRKRQSRHQAIQPEDKLTGFIIAAPLLAIGLWWFSWTIPPKVAHVHWIVSLLSLVLVGYAANEFECILAGYLADSYTVFAASAFAALALLRALCCAMFPLFAHQMFTDITPNVASSILAAVATVFCLCPVVFFRYGKRIRQSSKFAKYSLQASNENQVDDNDWEDDGPGSVVAAGDPVRLARVEN